MNIILYDIVNIERIEKKKNNNPEMLRLVPDHIKTENMCKNAVNKLPYKA